MDYICIIIYGLYMDYIYIYGNITVRGICVYIYMLYMDYNGIYYVSMM